MPARSFPNWLSSILLPRRRGKKRPVGSTRPKLEYLEDRVVPTGTTIDLSISPVQSTIHGGDSTHPGGDSTHPGFADFTVTRTGEQIAFHVGFHTVDGTAKAGIDYVAENADLSFAAGQDSATISVPLIGNNLDNGNKTFTVQLFNEAQFDVSKSATTYITAAAPRQMVFADINGDGKPDVVTADANTSEAQVFLNTTPSPLSKPTFAGQYAGAYTLTPKHSGKNDFDVKVADFNGDGKPDILLSDGDSGFVTLFLNQTPKDAATPKFNPVQVSIPIHPGDDVKFLTVGDFNGDGKLDFAVDDATTNAVYVVLQAKNSTSANVIFDAPVPVAKFKYGQGILDVTDINGDGRPDILVGDGAPAKLGGPVSTYAYLLVNTTPKGSHSPMFNELSIKTGANPVAVVSSYTTKAGKVKYVDFNGDGKPDFAWGDLYDSEYTPKGGKVTVALNTSPPISYSASAPEDTVNTGWGPRQLAVGDLNGDGLPDIVTANRDYHYAATAPGDDFLSIILNETPKGAKVADSAPQPLPFKPYSIAKPRSVALGDVNGDGKLDIGICDPIPATDSVAIFLNKTPTIVFLPQKATVTIINDNAPASLVVTPATNSSFTTEVGTAFNPGPSVTVDNKFGDPVQGVPVTFTAPKNGSGVATALINGTASFKGTTNASGVAALDGVTNPFAMANIVAGGPYTLTAVSGTFTQTFSMTNTPGPVAMLKFFGQPLTASIGSNLNPNGVTVEEVDQYGNLVPTTANDTITVSLDPASNPQGAQLSGNLGATYGPSVTATASGGIVTLNNLAVDTEGKNYDLQATATLGSGLSVSGFSNAFSIRGPATSFGLTAVGSGSGGSGGSGGGGKFQAAQLNVPTVITLQAFDALGQPAGNPPVTNVSIICTTGSAQLTFRNASADGSTLYYLLDSHTVGKQTYQITATVSGQTITSDFTLLTTLGSQQF